MGNLKAHKGTLEVLDGMPITPRTGQSKMKGEFANLPNNNGYFIFMYEQGLGQTESPGVALGPENVEKIGNEYRFFDFANRPFVLTVEE